MSQISAYISDDVKEKMERYTHEHGIKKGYLIENAINHYLQALYEIPTSIIVPNQIKVSESELYRVIEFNDKEPNENLKVLMHS